MKPHGCTPFQEAQRLAFPLEFSPPGGASRRLRTPLATLARSIKVKGTLDGTTPMLFMFLLPRLCRATRGCAMRFNVSETCYPLGVRGFTTVQIAGRLNEYGDQETLTLKRKKPPPPDGDGGSRDL